MSLVDPPPRRVSLVNLFASHQAAEPAGTRWLAAILVVAAFLRLYHLGDASLWYDEVISLDHARLSLRKLLTVSETDYNPPLYAFLLRLWLIGEPSEILLRLPSAILGFLSVFLLYRLGAFLFRREIGLFASGLLAISPGHIWYSQEARGYSLLVVLTLLSTHALASAIWKDRTGDWLVYTTSAVLGMYTSFLWASVLLFQHAFAIFYYRKERVRPSRKWLRSLVSICILSIPAAVFARHLLRLGLPDLNWVAGDVPRVGLLQLVFLAGQFSLGRSWPPPVSMAIGLPVFGVLFLAGIRSVVGRARPMPLSASAFPFGGWLCFAWLTIPPLTLVVASLIIKPIWHFRYVIVSLPAFLLVVAHCFASIERNQLKIVLAGGVLIASLLSVQKQYREPYKPDMRAAARTITSGFQHGDLILIDSSSQWLAHHPMKFYLKRVGALQDYPMLWLSPEQGRDLSVALPRALEAWQRLWFVVRVREERRMKVPGPVDRVLSGLYQRMREYRYYGLRLVLYELRGQT